MRKTIRTVVLIAVVSVAVLRVETGRADEGVTTTVGNRFSQTSTPRTNEQGTFEAVFTHRFNQAVKDAGGSTLWGLDSGAATGIGVDYVFVRNVAVQVYRVNNYADYEFALKATLVRPKASLPKDVVPDSVGQWSVAIQKQLFNHKFALWMGNSQASTVDQYVGGDYGGGVTDRNMKIGFNLIREWDLSPAK
jgi:Membrane bound beta barrel domain (DUF5777)